MQVIERIFHVELSCPRCGGTTVDALQRRGAIDTLLAMLQVHPYHCRRCYGKFYVLKVAPEISPQTVAGEIVKSGSPNTKRLSPTSQ
jgi:C4-type Zn-finger protein